MTEFVVQVLGRFQVLLPQFEGAEMPTFFLQFQIMAVFLKKVIKC